MAVVRRLTSLSLVWVAVACGGGSGNNGGGSGNTPSLSVSPGTWTFVAGGAPVDFTATLANAAGTVSWALGGPGSSNPSSGKMTRSMPPATEAASVTWTLTATSGRLTASATLTVNPPPTLTVSGRVTDGVGSAVSGATVAIGSQVGAVGHPRGVGSGCGRHRRGQQPDDGAGAARDDATSGSITAPDHFLITTGTSAPIPVLGTAGVVLPGATVYQWSINAVGPWPSVDAFAGGTGLLPTAGTTSNLSFSSSSRAFTTQ
jgi:hypothetical protein